MAWFPRARRSRLLIAAASGLLSALTVTWIGQSATPAFGAPGAPSAPPVTWCETGLPTSPYTSPPVGAVTIPAGNDATTAIMENYLVQPNTVYWFAPGTHTLGTSQWSQISVADGDTFVGAPGAVIDGDGINNSAFEAIDQNQSDVTIEYLTIEKFEAPDGQMVVGQGGYNGWTIEYNTIEDNPYGAGVALSTNGVVENNCLQYNGEYGFSTVGGSKDILFKHNDVYDNNNAGYYDIPGSTIQCGCSGGGKI